MRSTRICRAAVAVGLVVSALSLAMVDPGSGPVGAVANTYPYQPSPDCNESSGGNCVNDGWGFYKGQCTSYVAWRLRERGVGFDNWYRQPSGQRWSDAALWKAAAQRAGIPVDGSPAVGSVAWFSFGHVAYVDAVHANGSITYSDMNADYHNGFRGAVTASPGGSGWPSGFIHVADGGGSRDSDGDGTPDGQDHCPTTPAGPRPNPSRPGCPLRSSSDFNADGRDDLAYLEPGSDGAQVMQILGSTGTGFTRLWDAKPWGIPTWAGVGSFPRTNGDGSRAFRPFTSWDGFVSQQRTDFTGSAGTTAQRKPMVDALATGATSPAAAIATLMRGSWFSGSMAPNARLYWAYFGRIPDQAGLIYWADQHRRGVTLNKISDGFARSAEFRAQYGSLSDGAFVDRVYTNVLGRPASSNDRTYWTGELRKGRTRGAVMIGFSESAEYKAKMARSVDVVLTYAGLLRRSPTRAELATDATRPLSTVVDVIRLSAAYTRRVG